MHKCIRIQHSMHEEFYKNRKNQIKDQKNKSSIIGTISHPNETIVWSECLMRRDMRVKRMKIRDAHRQGVKSINHMFQQHTIFTQIQFSLQSTTSQKLKFHFSFDSFKSLKLRAMRSQKTKSTMMVINNLGPLGLLGRLITPQWWQVETNLDPFKSLR